MDAPPLLFDRALVRAHRDRARPSGHDAILVECAERLVERLDDVTRSFSHALAFGGGAALVEGLKARGVARVTAADLSPAVAARLPTPRLAADEERLPFADGAFDLIASGMHLHWVNDLPGALVQMRRALRPDGLLLACLPGPRTLEELRESFTAVAGEGFGLAPRIAPFAEVRDAGALLQRAGFALPVADAERLTISYPDVFALLADLRASGEANALVSRHRAGMPRALLARVAEHYHARYAEPDGRVRATLEIVTLTAWAPHASQPVAAKRGSGGVNLREVL